MKKSRWKNFILLGLSALWLVSCNILPTSPKSNSAAQGIVVEAAEQIGIQNGNRNYIYPSPFATPTATPFMPIQGTPTFQYIKPTPTQPTPTPFPAVPTPLPEKVELSVVPELQDYTLSCESAAASMAISHFGIEPPKGFTSWEEYLVRTIPRNCNPNKGFRGDINGILSTRCDSPYGYGVYAEPVAKALREAGIDAVAVTANYDELIHALAAGHPVVVWLSWKDRERYPVVYETDENGNKYPLVMQEHAVTIYGYKRVKGEQGYIFLVSDPLGRKYTISDIPRWEDFGNMALIIRGRLNRDPPSNLN